VLVLGHHHATAASGCVLVLGNHRNPITSRKIWIWGWKKVRSPWFVTGKGQNDGGRDEAAHGS